MCAQSETTCAKADSVGGSDVDAAEDDDAAFEPSNDDAIAACSRSFFAGFKQQINAGSIHAKPKVLMNLFIQSQRC